jgi:3-deoxy-D-arabino-heptulosonate 7-phosphate (DAHP) synthase class II/amino acid transporter
MNAGLALLGRPGGAAQAEQQPDWTEPVTTYRRELACLPGLVSDAECADLQALLAAAANRRAVVIQGGDCAERFAEADRSATLAKVAQLRALGAQLRRDTGAEAVMIGRLAGQYAKPRSSPWDRTPGGALVPSYRGDAINGPDPGQRAADPRRLLMAYDCAASVLHAVRTTWPRTAADRVYASHEALLLDYETPLVRRGSSGRYGSSGHLLWIGDRTRQLDGSHVALAAGIANPVAVKLGPSTSPAEAVALGRMLNPEGIAGRLTFVVRLGAARIARLLPPIVAAVARQGPPVVWLSDPMHGNTMRTAAGLKTRAISVINYEVAQFVRILRRHGEWPAGLHLELTPGDVTECVASRQQAERAMLPRYCSACDPRLDSAQAHDVTAAFGALLLPIVLPRRQRTGGRTNKPRYGVPAEASGRKVSRHMAAQIVDQPPGELRRDAIGLSGAIFTSVTAMAPASGAVFSITVGGLFAGGSLSAGVLLALAGCLLTALSIAQFARHLPSAGGMSTYIAHGLGNRLGWLAGWGFSLAYPMVIPALTLLFGSVLGSMVETHFGMSYSLWWVIGMVFSLVLAGALNYFGIRVSTRSGLILGALEIVVMVALSMTLIVKAGAHNTLSVFTTRYATIPGFRGIPGIIAGSVYGLLAFAGFDAAAPLAEETKNPRRNVGWAIVGSCLTVGFFYLLTTYAATVFFGPAKFAGFYTAGGGNPWNLLATTVWGTGWVALFIALLNSNAASANSAGCAGSRYVWALGRSRVLPGVLGRTHPRWGSPYVAVIVTFGAGLVLALWLGEQYTPLTAFALMGTILTGAIVPIYITVNIACIGYFWRKRRDEFHIIRHGLIPLLGIVLFVSGFFANFGITLFKFVSPLSYPLNLAGIIVAVWYGIGAALVIYLSVRRPASVHDTAAVFEGAVTT